jgi:hypothetical protein
MRIKSFLFVLGLLSPCSQVSAKELVDLAAACRPGGRADSSDELRLRTGGGITLCVDRRAYLSNISIKLAELRYSGALDLYMLFLFVDPADKARLAEYSRSHLHERIYLIRDRFIELDAEMEAPLVNGYINVSVPSQAEGEALMDKIVPPKNSANKRQKIGAEAVKAS